HDFALSVRDADPFAGFRRAHAACASPDPLDRALYVDVNTYLVDDIMTKVDRMSMAVALEAREPLLDHRLLEFAAPVPSSRALQTGTRTPPARRLGGGPRGAPLLNRPKGGFAVRAAGGLGVPLAGLADDLLQAGPPHDRGFSGAGATARLWSEHRTRRQD